MLQLVVASVTSLRMVATFPSTMVSSSSWKIINPSDLAGTACNSLKKLLSPPQHLCPPCINVFKPDWPAIGGFVQTTSFVSLLQSVGEPCRRGTRTLAGVKVEKIIGGRLWDFSHPFFVDYEVQEVMWVDEEVGGDVNEEG